MSCNCSKPAVLGDYTVKADGWSSKTAYEQQNIFKQMQYQQKLAAIGALSGVLLMAAGLKIAHKI
ncbi:MAG: hypothetical protein LBO69_06685 [Ignavibacteria bacterium]|jgi:hypothetical protein|nr:hypothetical protein [Ignavibacteria bacterium]